MSKSICFLIAILLTVLNLKAESENFNKPDSSTFQLTVIIKGCLGSRVISIPEDINSIWCAGDSHCTASINAGSFVTLQAVPFVGCKFTRWEGESSDGQTLTFKMDKNKTVTAYFEISDEDNDGHPNVMDYDDHDPFVWRSAMLFIDTDRDGFDGGSKKVPYGDNLPIGYSDKSMGNDCNDKSASDWHSEILFIDSDRDGHSIGSKDTCFGVSIPLGYSVSSIGFDCDDDNSSIYQPVLWYLDKDGDGYAASTILSCKSPGYGYTTKTLPLEDCNDMDSSIYTPKIYYIDADHDGYGSLKHERICYNIVPSGFSVISGDCDDSNSAIHSERKYFKDHDSDGFGDSRFFMFSCQTKAPETYVGDSSDCNDFRLMYADLDGDGFGANILAACNGVTNNIDCNDNDPTIHQDCRGESIYIPRDSVLPPTNPTVIVSHGLIHINIQTMQEVNIKVRDTVSGGGIRSESYKYSQPYGELYQPIDSAHLTITIPVSRNNNNPDQSIKIEIFNTPRGQNNTQFASRRKDQ